MASSLSSSFERCRSGSENPGWFSTLYGRSFKVTDKIKSYKKIAVLHMQFTKLGESYTVPRKFFNKV